MIDPNEAGARCRGFVLTELTVPNAGKIEPVVEKVEYSAPNAADSRQHHLTFAGLLLEWVRAEHSRALHGCGRIVDFESDGIG